MPDQPDDFFAELEAEIKEATAKAHLKADAANLRKKANNMRISPAERQRASDEFKSIQAIIEVTEWKSVAYGTLFTEQECDGCGSKHYTFLQFMKQEQKIREPGAKRWVRISRPNGDLPTLTIIQPLKTHICASCAGEHGFDVETPEIRLLPIEGQITVSGTYQQEDINESQEEN